MQDSDFSPEALTEILTEISGTDRQMLSQIVKRWGSLSNELKRAVLRVVSSRSEMKASVLDVEITLAKFDNRDNDCKFIRKISLKPCFAFPVDWFHGWRLDDLFPHRSQTVSRLLKATTLTK